MNYYESELCWFKRLVNVFNDFVKKGICVILFVWFFFLVLKI